MIHIVWLEGLLQSKIYNWIYQRLLLLSSLLKQLHEFYFYSLEHSDKPIHEPSLVPRLKPSEILLIPICFIIHEGMETSFLLATAISLFACFFFFF